MKWEKKNKERVHPQRCLDNSSENRNEIGENEAQNSAALLKIGSEEGEISHPRYKDKRHPALKFLGRRGTAKRRA